MGLGRTVSDGIISAIREIPDRGLVFQMTAPISRGSSGSPVIDMHGNVVGVAFLQIVNGQNLNFAIPGENIIKLKVQLVKESGFGSHLVGFKKTQSGLY